MTMNVLRPLCRLAMRILSTVVLAASFVAVPAAQPADKPARPTEVRGVKLTSICIDCAVVSDMRKETVVKGKGSGKAAVDGAAASGASAGTQGGKTVTVWTMTVIFKNGTTQTYQQGRNPGLHPGDVVTIQEGIPRKYVP